MEREFIILKINPFERRGNCEAVKMRHFFKNLPVKNLCTRNANVDTKTSIYSEHSRLLKSLPPDKNGGPKRGSMFNIETNRENVSRSSSQEEQCCNW